MRIIRILLLVVVIVVAIVAVGGVIIFNRWTRGPLPQLDGDITLKPETVSIGEQSVDISGLQDRVEIIRDNWGIPHIYASNTHDLFFAQGYSQAQDRWWQMEFSRHIGAGRIEELTGKNKAVLNNDIFIRKFGWYEAAQRDYAAADDDSKATLQAFADGVNAYILNRDKGALALEYNLLGVTGINIIVEPWTPVDSLVWAKVMADNLSGNWQDELTRSALYDKLGQKMTDDWMRPWPFGEKPTIVHPEDLPITDSSLTTANDTAGIVGIDNSFVRDLQANDMTAVFGRGAGIGSNNWVISGKLTQSGKPLLANDPHLGIQMPSIWYEIGLHCQPVSDKCPYNVDGFALPAAPGVVIGHNDRIAWGFTNVGPDTQDLYRIKVNPDNDLQYEFNGQWVDMTVRDETIKFGDGEAPVTLKIRETRFGPIINDYKVDKDTGEIGGYNNTDPVAYHWTALNEPSTILKSVYLLNRAGNWGQFREAASYFDVPAQNMIYADVDGNIGYQTPGRIPIRAEGHSGLLPVDGTTDKYDWKGYIPFDDLPRVLNPERGYIATANQAVVPLEYYDQLQKKLAARFGENSNYFISQTWDYGYRGQRVEELIQGLAPHTIQTIQTIQGDDKWIPAEELSAYLKVLDFGDTKYNDARDWMLNGWDDQFTMDSAQAGLYAYFWQSLMSNLYDDQLGDVTQADGSDLSLFATTQLAADPTNVWWDDTRTSDVTETRDDILIRSFKQAYDQISKDHGDNRDNWQWGKIHAATWVSNPLGASGIGLIESMVNRGPYGAAGGMSIVNATSWDTRDGDFKVKWLPSMRFIADLSDLSKSLTSDTTGQSGHPFSPHYSDMIDQWRTIQYHPMLWTREQIVAATVDRLVLIPGA
jgi:penicillin G amidase